MNIRRTAPVELFSPADHRANEYFELLKEGSLVEKDAKLLFKTNAVEKEQFIQRVETIAESFLDARAALRRLLRLTLIGTAYAESTNAVPAARKREFQKEIASFAASLIHPDRLRELLDMVLKQDPASSLTRSAKEILQTLLNQLEEKKHSSQAAQNDLLEEFLNSKGSEAANALLQLDILAEKGTGPLAQQGRKWMFGITRGPLEVSWTEVNEALAQVEYFMTGGLEGGRLDEGLEMLIENYLNAANLRPRVEERVRNERERLQDVLVSFAQKILFISNYSTLLDDSDQGKLREYILVLQAVGNSILVQVDELRQRDAHRTHLIARTEATLNAAANAGFTNTSLFANAKDVKTAIEELTTALRLEYVHELETNGSICITTNGTNAVLSSRANGLLEAIKAATEMRADEIYLRPASAYLRNSYPATSLQNNAPLEWRNMLADHAWHQVPFIGGLGTYEDQRNNKAVREIDKQFWQNVNRVRVSGAGSVNYVIAKDDVGNWYVKQFGSQVSNIVNSAKNLAFFAAGPSLGASLPIKKADGTAIFSATGTNGASGPSILDRQFELSTSAYSNSTAQAFFALTEVATNLTQRLDAEWQAESNAIGATNLAQLHAAAQTAMSALTNQTVSPNADKKNESDYGKGTEKLLKGIKRYDHAVVAQIDQTNFNSEQKTVAKKALREITLDLVKEFIRRREGVLERYESELALIGGSVGP